MSKDQGELATGVLLMCALGLYIIFLVDRYLIKKAKYKTVLVGEILFLLLLPFVYMYLDKDTRIYIDTNKSYFVLVYKTNGLTKKQIPLNGLFDHAITLKTDSVINLDYSLLNDESVYVLEPKSWGGYKAKYIDTVINSNKVKIEMRSNDLSDQQRDSIIKKLLPMGFCNIGADGITINICNSIWLLFGQTSFNLAFCCYFQHQFFN